MAFPPHIQVALKIFPHLVETANAKTRTNYEEIAAAARMQTRLFGKPLAFIRDEICIRHKLPPLTVIVDNKGPDRATNTFCPEELKNLSAAEYTKLKEEMRQQVYSYPNWDMVLERLNKLYCVT